MMGFLRHLQPEKFISLNQKIGEEKNTFPYQFFQSVKLSLDGLLPSRAHLRFTLQDKCISYNLILGYIIINRKLDTLNLVSTIFMKGQIHNS